MRYSSALFQKLRVVGTNLVRVPSSEGDTPSVAGGVAARGSIASVTIEGDNVSGDLECKEDSGDERNGATHCLGSKKTW
jgi:hypothetical protein